MEEFTYTGAYVDGYFEPPVLLLFDRSQGSTVLHEWSTWQLLLIMSRLISTTHGKVLVFQEGLALEVL